MQDHAFTHILFDFDGTLVDSAPGVLESLTEAFRRCGVTPQIAIDESLIGPPLNAMLRSLAPDCGETALAELSAEFRSQYDSVGYLRTTPYPNVTRVLAELRRRSIAATVVTNKRIAVTRKIVTALEWDGLMNGIYGLDSFEPSLREKSTLVERVMRIQNVSPSAVILVGDSADDCRAAREHGLRFLRAGWGYKTARLDDVLSSSAAIARPEDLILFLVQGCS